MANNLSNFSGLPFFTRLDGQDFRKEYSGGAIPHYIAAPIKTLIPFQFNVPQGTDINSCSLFNIEDGKEADITSQMEEAGLTVLNGGRVYDNLLFPADKILQNVIFKAGPVYIVIRTTSGTYYSEIFTLITTVTGYMKVSWRSNEDMNLMGGRKILFPKGFYFTMYVPAELSNPTYNFEEQATDRLGKTYIETQVSRKTYNFSFIATEPLMDALRLMRMCELKSITNRGVTYEPIDFGMDVQWTSQPNYCLCDVSFSTDNVAINLGGYDDNSTGYTFTHDFKGNSSLTESGATIKFNITSTSWDGSAALFGSESSRADVKISVGEDSNGVFPITIIIPPLERGNEPQDFSIDFNQIDSGNTLSIGFSQSNNILSAPEMDLWLNSEAPENVSDFASIPVVSSKNGKFDGAKAWVHDSDGTLDITATTDATWVDTYILNMGDKETRGNLFVDAIVGEPNDTTDIRTANLTIRQTSTGKTLTRKIRQLPKGQTFTLRSSIGAIVSRQIFKDGKAHNLSLTKSINGKETEIGLNVKANKEPNSVLAGWTEIGGTGDSPSTEIQKKIWIVQYPGSNLEKRLVPDTSTSDITFDYRGSDWTTANDMRLLVAVDENGSVMKDNCTANVGAAWLHWRTAPNTGSVWLWCDANNDYPTSKRNTTVTVTNGTISKTYNVTQYGRNWSWWIDFQRTKDLASLDERSADYTNIELSASSGRLILMGIKVTVSDESWIHVTETSTLKYRIKIDHNDGNDRSGWIMWQDGNGKNIAVPVIQRGA